MARWRSARRRTEEIYRKGRQPTASLRCLFGAQSGDSSEVSGNLELARLAGPIPGPRIRRYAGIRALTLARRSVPQVHAVAARSAARLRPATCHRARPEYRFVS